MRRHGPILLLLYMALDFANPLMPGAVSFEAGSIQVVPGDRTARAARSATTPARPVTVFPTLVVGQVGAGLTRPPALASPPPSRALRAARRPPPQILAAPSSPEDH